MMGEDRAVAKGIVCVSPVEEGAVPVPMGNGGGCGERRSGDSARSSGSRCAPGREWTCHRWVVTSVASFHLDNSKYQWDCSIQMGIHFFVFSIKEVNK